MVSTSEQLNIWMKSQEDESLEFKEAKNHFDFEKLTKYCAAIANEGGGKIILGITDKLPRRVVGCQEFNNLIRTKAGLVERLHVRVDAEEISHANGRVVIFHIPSRPIGYPIQYKGAYWMRAGEDLVPMTQDHLKKIFAESGPDFSAEICFNASFADLDPAAINRFRTLWQRKAKNPTFEALTDEQLLHDAELVVDQGVTFAALVLFGTKKALGRHFGAGRDHL